MSGFITTETVVENHELIVELWGVEIYEAALVTTEPTWLDFLNAIGIL